MVIKPFHKYKLEGTWQCNEEVGRGKEETIHKSANQKDSLAAKERQAIAKMKWDIKSFWMAKFKSSSNQILLMEI